VLLNRLLNLEEDECVFLSEESMQDLLDLPVTAEIMETGLDADDLIEISNLGIALHLSEPAPIWLLLTDKYSDRKILQDHAEKWKGLPGRKTEASEKDFFLALTEYFSVSLMQELLCEECQIKGAPFFVEERIERLASLVGPRTPPGASILEICCGSGMATQALLRLGHRPLAMDSDRCDLCQSLKSDLMDPQSCFVLDARLLPRFFAPQSFQIVMGFMVGLIDDFNWPLWRDILLKASSLAKERVLFTTYTQKEAELIAKALGGTGWKGEVIDHRDPSGIYDQWAYYGQKLA
jgi:hypothetical protein